MSKPLNFQQVILKLHQFWAEQGCIIWEPYNVQLGAGTANPATLLRALGPEPWRVAYVEPSVRPDDGRYGENPNRMQKYYQYQVILKPDPGNPQEIYLQSLEALGIDPRQHDIRFVEDNWESPALGAWGLGWEVWLDGQEITQFTYFQQAGGVELRPVSVEITYGIERIVLALQGKESAWEIDWMPGITYHDMMFNEEVEHCRYYFDIADVEALKRVYDTYEAEYKRALEGDALIAAYDYVNKCSHLFNVLDTRGAIGVTERAGYFRRMRDMTRNVASAYVAKREELGFPLMKQASAWAEPERGVVNPMVTTQSPSEEAADFLLEIGVEELPAADVDVAVAQLQTSASALFDELRLNHERLNVYATPRRIVLYAAGLAPTQTDVELEHRGPPASRAFDADGQPTKAAEGFARGKGADVAALTVKQIDGGEYVTVTVKEAGRPTVAVLAEVLPELISGLKFGKSMRWNSTDVAFSRPIRWLTALFGASVVPFEYAGVASGHLTHGLRPYGSPPLLVETPADYLEKIAGQGIIISRAERRQAVVEQVRALAEAVDGRVPDDPALLDEVTNLIEAPTALRGSFDHAYLELPREVLVTVMRKHQRYFPVERGDGRLLPYFITVRNGDDQHLDKVAHGNEHVIRARFSDAQFFYEEDRAKPLADYLPRLNTLTFQEKLGSMLDKNNRVAGLVDGLGDLFGVSGTDIAIAHRAAKIAKADLATNMVVEMTSLQGVMGREYARLEGYPLEVANAIFEHWLPRNADDGLPASDAGAVLGLTDRLDSLVGLFAAGLAPRATADPYGLRRAALGIIQIMAGKNIDADLRQAVNLTSAAQPINVSTEDQEKVLAFITGRLQGWLADQGYAADVVKAVIAQQSANPHRAAVACGQLAAWVARDDWGDVLDSFARCVRITRSESERYTVDPALFAQEEETALYRAYQNAQAKLDDNAGDLDAFLSVFAEMVPAVTAYFGTGKGDGVLVNADDPAIRRNRLGLLQAISAMQDGHADLSELAGF
ncbi:MAG: glycine--tRNA ligase subunit beta [Anaerolineaceae bacterium]|nr:MAG: glycine--tRNA ligase subunit beta [Anaerolineaceae bacterium]